MTADVVTIANTSYLVIVKQMYQRGELTLEQYAGCLRRARERLTCQ